MNMEGGPAALEVASWVIIEEGDLVPYNDGLNILAGIPTQLLWNALLPQVTI